MFYKDLNLLRALSIFFVVSAHCLRLQIFVFNNDSIEYKTIVYLFGGSTSFFVFILGFLFFVKFNENFNYGAFLYKKLKFVFFPYLVFCHFDVIYYSVFLFSKKLLGLKFDSALLFDYSYLNAVLYGDSTIPIGLWFIPVALIIYLILPVLVNVSKSNRMFKIVLLILTSLIASLVHRNFDNNILYMIYNVIYFLPFLLLGFFLSKGYSYFTKINSPFYYLVLLLFALIAFFLQCEIGQITKFNGHLILSNIDFGVFQKLSLTVLLFLIFSRVKKNGLSIIQAIGLDSFGIFFIHGIVIYFLNIILRHSNILFITDSFLVYVLTSIFVTYLSFMIVQYSKLFLGKYSKYIIGC